MAEHTRAGEWTLTGLPAMDDRLSPAEAHNVVRQRLERLAAPWSLKPADIHQLARRMRTLTYAPGEIIVPRGAHADCLGLVVRGQAAVRLGRRGADRLAAALLPGSVFGEAMLVEGQPSQATLQALTPCAIRILRRADLQALSAERRIERQAAMLWRLVKGSALLVALLLATVVALTVPSSRRAIAVVPMGVGQWCSDQGYDLCAGQAWQAAANLTPTDPNPLLALGTLYYEQGAVSAAERSFEAARALDPDLPEAHNNLGLIYARQGEHERAIAAFRRALELEPGVAATEYNLGLSLQAIHAYDEAVSHYQAALALGEPQTHTLVNMATAYYEAGRPAQALAAARKSLLYDETLAPAYLVLGAVALESRQPEEALSHLRRAVALDARSCQVYFYLGLAYKASGRSAEAIAAFEQALAIAADEGVRVRIRRHLNELYEAAGQSRLP